MMDESYSSCELNKYRKKNHAKTRISSFTALCQETRSSAGMLPRLMQLFKEKIPFWKDIVLKIDITEIHTLKNMCKTQLFSFIYMKNGREEKFRTIALMKSCVVFVFKKRGHLIFNCVTKYSTVASFLSLGPLCPEY